MATIGRCYYWSHTLARSMRLYTGECVVDSSTGLWDRADEDYVPSEEPSSEDPPYEPTKKELKRADKEGDQ